MNVLQNYIRFFLFFFFLVIFQSVGNFFLGGGGLGRMGSYIRLMHMSPFCPSPLPSIMWALQLFLYHTSHMVAMCLTPQMGDPSCSWTIV